MPFRMIMLTLLTLIASPTIAENNTYICPTDFDGYLPPRLVAGEAARILETPVNLRPQPTTSIARLDQVPVGVTVQINDGPACNEGFVWWGVMYGDQVGWIAEGSATSGDYWTEPRGELVIITGDDDIPRFYVQRDDGTLEPDGCMRPPDDYSRTNIGYAIFNRRTLFMLDNASRVYRGWGGIYSFRDLITQGGYNPGGVDASFGTHDGGGAVDISVRSRVDWSIMWGEIPYMIEALRIAGFAAWVRDTGELFPNSPIHIHAIAVGDLEASPIARDQVDGERGYLRGYNGLPESYGLPLLDGWGEPVICGWMIEDGFPDLREPDYYYEIAMRYIEAGDTLGALEQLTRGVTVFPDDVTLYEAWQTLVDDLGEDA